MQDNSFYDYLVIHSSVRGGDWAEVEGVDGRLYISHPDGKIEEHTRGRLGGGAQERGARSTGGWWRKTVAGNE